MYRDLPALTGIRFLAAFAVVLAHGTLLIVGLTNLPRVVAEITKLSALGMSMFFVLSGFVIHYTYSSSIRTSNGKYNFLVARFARLYPLYISLFLVEFLYGSFTQQPSPFGSDLRALPYYLTLTQSWWYVVFNERSLIYQFGEIAQVSWSISTEVWLYLAYLGIVVLLGRIRTPAGTLTAGFISSGLAILAVLLVSTHSDAIRQVGGYLFGEIADGRGSREGQDSLFRWLVYFSPYFRVGEFLLGCLTAHLFIQLSDRPVTTGEQRVGSMLTWLALAAMVATHVIVFLPDSLPVRVPRAVSTLHMNFGFAPSCALLIFAVARYNSVVTRLLSARPVVALGAASYSIYLLHMLFFMWFAADPADPSYGGDVFRVAKMLAVIALLFAVSRVTYLIVEMPARRWLRHRFSMRVENMKLASRRINTVLAITCGVILLPVISFTYVLAKGARQTSEATAGRAFDDGIRIVSAVYGENCTSSPVDVTSLARKRCEGRAACAYIVSVAVLGDPAPGCGKDFRVEWACPSDELTRRVLLPPEAGFRSVAQLDCPIENTK